MEIDNFWAAIASYRWVLFGLVVIWVLRQGFSLLLVSFANLCNRIKSTTFEFIGMKFGADASSSLGSEGINDEKFNVFLKAFQSPVITTEEKTIRNQLAEAKCSDGQAITVLISQLANRNVLTLLCLIDRSIYEEQIKLLLHLNTNNKTCTGDELQQFYTLWYEKSIKFKEAISAIDDKASSYANSTYEQFLGFLVTHGLISQNISGYSITPLGKDYLSFIVRVGRQLPQNKVDESILKNDNG